jgi:hypothetical protein
MLVRTNKQNDICMDTNPTSNPDRDCEEEELAREKVLPTLTAVEGRDSIISPTSS